MEPSKKAAQCQLLLIVLVIILSLFSYCLISLSKPQPDLHHGDQVKSNSDRIYTNDFSRVPKSHLLLDCCSAGRGRREKKKI